MAQKDLFCMQVPWLTASVPAVPRRSLGATSPSPQLTALHVSCSLLVISPDLASPDLASPDLTCARRWLDRALRGNEAWGPEWANMDANAVGEYYSTYFSYSRLGHISTAEHSTAYLAQQSRAENCAAKRGIAQRSYSIAVA